MELSVDSTRVEEVGQLHRSTARTAMLRHDSFIDIPPQSPVLTDYIRSSIPIRQHRCVCHKKRAPSSSLKDTHISVLSFSLSDLYQ